MEKNQRNQMSGLRISKFSEMMREILLGYCTEKFINYLFLLSSDPLFQRPFKVLNYLQMIRALIMYFPVHAYMLQAIAIFIWKSVNCCRSFLSLWFSKLWMWHHLISVSSLVFVRTEDARLTSLILLLSSMLPPWQFFLIVLFLDTFFTCWRVLFFWTSRNYFMLGGLVWS